MDFDLPSKALKRASQSARRYTRQINRILRKQWTPVRFLAGRFYFKLIVWCIPFILCGIFTGCDDIPRDNVLDPKNPSSTRPQKVLVEAFVNINDSLQGSNINEFALAALDSLNRIHSPKLVIVAYHRNTRDFIDPYHLPENEFLYQKYIDQFNAMAGVPDVFINATARRVQGASSTQNSITRIGNALSGLLNDTTRFSLEPDYERNGNQVTPQVTVARLGATDAGNIVLKAVLTAQIDQNYLKRVARDFSAEGIPLLEHGTFRTFNMDPLSITEPQFPHALVVYLTDSSESIVYQCGMIEIQ